MAQHRQLTSVQILVLSAWFLLLSIVFTPHLTHAYSINDGWNAVGSVAATNTGSSSVSLSAFILNVLKVALGLVGIIAVAAVIYGGFTYITSFGNEDRAKTAKQIILYAIIGLIIIGGAAIVVNLLITEVVKK